MAELRGLGGSHGLAGPVAASEGRSPWGPLDGNQLAGLGVDVASELCSAHIISIPPTLIKPKEIYPSRCSANEKGLGGDRLLFVNYKAFSL